MELLISGSRLSVDEVSAVLSPPLGAALQRCELRAVSGARGDPAIIAAIIGAGASVVVVVVEKLLSHIMEHRKLKAKEEFRPVTAPLIKVTVVQINTIVYQHQQRYTAEADIRPSVEEIRARLPESTEEGAATSISVDVMG